MFEVVPRDKISLRIIEQIRRSILSGKLVPGHRLSSEKELMVEFGVSKQTIREALRALEVLGFLEIRKGANGGAVVIEVSEQTARDSIANYLHFKNVSIQDLAETRRLTEPYLAKLAAERMTPEDIDELEEIYQAHRQALDRGEAIYGGENEIGFHTRIAEASDNPVLILIMDFVHSLFREIKLEIRPGLGFSWMVSAAHGRILDAIKAGDCGRAAAEKLRHIDEVEKELATLQALRGGNGG
ncbi:GntR family transcriptional regulator [Desulfosarcina ovata subsp. sediminis]|uniref:GntR family transcriptional regulator n=1 Tax=Desulfosarcina ovata subsp. sediminis TaxID=885957 RepID=A0A5K7ZUB5_9BACT|nr:FadR/GntR family transcriptional regulator [Desulfosarcina ovata]BBO83812.1 GntR family transcriptional regulator [Desulfosarcina ovata subsp. sediminis]